MTNPLLQMLFGGKSDGSNMNLPGVVAQQGQNQQAAISALGQLLGQRPASKISQAGPMQGRWGSGGLASWYEQNPYARTGEFDPNGTMAGRRRSVDIARGDTQGRNALMEDELYAQFLGNMMGAMRGQQPSPGVGLNNSNEQGNGGFGYMGGIGGGESGGAITPVTKPQLSQAEYEAARNQAAKGGLDGAVNPFQQDGGFPTWGRGTGAPVTQTTSFDFTNAAPLSGPTSSNSVIDDYMIAQAFGAGPMNGPQDAFGAIRGQTPQGVQGQGQPLISLGDLGRTAAGQAGMGWYQGANAAGDALTGMGRDLMMWPVDAYNAADEQFQKSQLLLRTLFNQLGL